MKALRFIIIIISITVTGSGGRWVACCSELLALGQPFSTFLSFIRILIMVSVQWTKAQDKYAYEFIIFKMNKRIGKLAQISCQRQMHGIFLILFCIHYHFQWNGVAGEHYLS